MNVPFLFQPHTPPPGELACDDWSAPASPWLCPLSGFGLIRASGGDAFNFLNNQLSNDLEGISETVSQSSAYCSPKGRLYCIFRVFMRGPHYYLRTTADKLDDTVDRLRLFILRAETVLDKEVALGGVGLIGPRSARLIRAAGLPVPAAVSDHVQGDECSVIRSPGICERYEIYAPHAKLATVWDALAPDAVVANGEVWRLYDIFSGIPNIYPQTSESFVPQMVNLDLVGALSFSKGCYPGQEVVARTHYLGKLKRRMYRLALPQTQAQTTPAPGDAVFVPAYSEEQPSGEIVDACGLAGGAVECLASLRIRGLEQGEARLGAADGAAADIRPLPYEITAETQA